MVSPWSVVVTVSMLNISSWVLVEPVLGQCSATMVTGGSLGLTASLCTTDLITAKFDPLGDFCVFDSRSQPLWCAGVDHGKGNRITLETNGNLVIYGDKDAIWKSAGTVNKGGSRLELRRLGNLQLYDTASNVIWESHDPCATANPCVNGASCASAQQSGHYCSCGFDSEGDLCEVRKEFKQLGCFVSHDGSSMSSDAIAVVPQGGLTVGSCTLECRNRSLPFAALEEASRCFCASHYDATAIASTDECNQACESAPWQSCGATDRTSVYAAIPTVLLASSPWTLEPSKRDVNVADPITFVIRAPIDVASSSVSSQNVSSELSSDSWKSWNVGSTAWLNGTVLVEGSAVIADAVCPGQQLLVNVSINLDGTVLSQTVECCHIVEPTMEFTAPVDRLATTGTDPVDANLTVRFDLPPEQCEPVIELTWHETVTLQPLWIAIASASAETTMVSTTSQTTWRHVLSGLRHSSPAKLAIVMAATVTVAPPPGPTYHYLSVRAQFSSSYAMTSTIQFNTSPPATTPTPSLTTTYQTSTGSLSTTRTSPESVSPAATTTRPRAYYRPDPAPTPTPNYCESSPCLNNATCSSLAAGYVCTCPEHVAGYLCEAVVGGPCDLSPCMHEARCFVGAAGTPFCECPPGLSDANCSSDINECLSSPCLFGQCLDRLGFFECRCDAGYEGARCEFEVDECRSSPCRMNGTCYDWVNDFNCSCIAGLRGKACEENVDDCSSGPCRNDAFCEDGLHNYTCRCTSYFKGQHCEIKSQELVTIEQASRGTAVIAIGVLIALFLTLFVIDLSRLLCRQRSPTKGKTGY